MIAIDEAPRVESPRAAPRLAPVQVCFVAPNAYGALSGRTDLAHVGGGAERQVSILAQALAERGHHVSVITANHGQSDDIVHQGVRVLRAYAPDAGVRGLRFLWPRATSVWSAMTRADADVYIQRCADSVTGVAAAWCRLHGRAFVFAAASDADCRTDLPNLSTRRDRAFFRFGLRRADRVIAQTQAQQRLLGSVHGIESRLIHSCAPDVNDALVERVLPTAVNERRVLWVGRFTRNKRLELLLQLAAELPEFAFDVVGSPYVESDYTRDLHRRAAELPNVVLHGQVPGNEIGAFYARAHALVCTSGWEGFPNTFLEAWSHGCPTVSTVDVDGAIMSRRLGAAAADAADLATALRRMLSNRDEWTECSRRVRSHFLANHSIDRAVDAYEQVLQELTA